MEMLPFFAQIFKRVYIIIVAIFSKASYNKKRYYGETAYALPKTEGIA